MMDAFDYLDHLYGSITGPPDREEAEILVGDVKDFVDLNYSSRETRKIISNNMDYTPSLGEVSYIDNCYSVRGEVPDQIINQLSDNNLLNNRLSRVTEILGF